MALLLLLFAAIPANAQTYVGTEAVALNCSSKHVSWNNYRVTLRGLTDLYRLGRYGELEEALECLISSDRSFQSGQHGAVAAYWFFRNEMPAPGDVEGARQKINRWAAEFPDSEYVGFARLRLMYSEAWSYRGTAYASDTQEEQLRKFQEGLVKAETAMLADNASLGETPVLLNLLLAVELDSAEPSIDPVDIFQIGVANWPNYYDFYHVLLTRLVPKWGGSWEAVDSFIDFWSQQDSEYLGESMYARLYFDVHSHGADPAVTRVSWVRLKGSLAALTESYPTAKHQAIAASYACYFEDKDQYNIYSSRLGPNNVGDRKAWIRGTSRQRCDSDFGYSDAK